MFRLKFGNRKVEVDGIRFSSQREAQFYAELKLREKAGEIRNLELQPRFTLQPAFKNAAGKKIRPLVYIADFKFWDEIEKRIRIVDVKGFRPYSYEIKKKLFDFLMVPQNIYLEEET